MNWPAHRSKCEAKLRFSQARMGQTIRTTKKTPGRHSVARDLPALTGVTSSCHMSRSQPATVAFYAALGGVLLLAVYVACFDPSALASFVTFAGLTIGVASLLGRYLRSPYSLVSIATASYCYIAAMSLFCITCYLNNYGSPFGPSADDSFYFQNTLDLCNGWAYSPTLFEATLAVITRSLCGLRGTPTLLVLLPFNYMCASLVTALACHLSYEITHLKHNAFLLCAMLLGLNQFTDSVVHLYRDAYLFLFVTLALVFIARSQWMAAIMVCSPALLLRPFNFVLVMCYWFLKRIENRSMQRTTVKMLAQGSCVIAVVVAALLADAQFHLGSYTRSIHTDQEAVGLVERISDRGELVESSTRDDDVTADLWRSGWGRVLMPVLVVLNPCKFPTSYVYLESYSLRYSSGLAEGLWPFSVFIALNVILLPFLISLLVLGVVRAFKIGASSELLVFTVTLLMLAFVSLQGRHRMALYVLYPTFWSWGLCEYWRHRSLAWMTAMVVLVIILFRSVT